ncbi:hypothetical protein [Butyrivibrio sp. AE2032]|uniref:hypothetical protein n=1 Tax=Butyrivibrio sp. AE2032 TaxID=1458463 RepID=UPI00055994DD|nr:hypothetical protein [Butyrivibrio sp. AE2032]
MKTYTLNNEKKAVTDELIVLTPEQLKALSGGNYDNGESCPGREYGHCDLEFTGKTKPGAIFRSLWPNYEMKCKYCGRTQWNMWGF